MATINQVKQLAEADTPLLFFQCVLPSGDVQYWSTYTIPFNGQIYSARVLKHNLFDLQLSADDAMDGISRLSLTLANADSALSQLNAVIGFKGTQLTVYFAFADLSTLTITTESTVLFRGVAGDPDEIGEDFLNLSFTNKLSLQRIPVPDVRIQRSCPWNFPSDIDQRVEAENGGVSGRYSRFYRCGYSADVSGGVGTLNAGQAFTSCDKSRGQCQQRGMFNADASGNSTLRFGGFEFVPSAIMVRTAGAQTSHLSALIDNTAQYNDPVPLIYGTGWLKSPVIFARNDGNLTHMETLLGMGTIDGILKVVVNNVEIPLGVVGQDMSATGWYAIVTNGGRQGGMNLDFVDASRNPLGDPHGSIASLSVIVPNQISSGRSTPNVEVLLRGMQIESFAASGTSLGNAYSNNPAWVILEILRRCGWSTSDINLSTFATSASVCQELISTTDLNGNPIQVPRFECNLILTKRQSAAAVIRGIRVASSLMLRYGATGLLELLPETTLAQQQPTLPDGSNSVEQLNGGWPAYEFSDGSASFSGIARNPNGSSSVRLTSQTVAETSNRLSVEFQDESNEYQQDSLSLVDSDDVALIGYENSTQSTALGIANFSQATRVLLRQLDKSTKGNLYVEFITSFRALKIRPGDIISFTYVREGFERAPFRVVKLSPSTNYELVTVLAQVHDDDWYSDNLATLGGAGRQPGTETQIPLPLIGLLPHDDSSGTFEFFDFKIQESIQTLQDGSATDILSVGFSVPVSPSTNASSLPLLSLSPTISNTGGTLAGGSNLYYAVSAVNSSGNESGLSFTVPAILPPGANTFTASLNNLSFPSTASKFHVYRGSSPQLLYRIASEVPLNNTFTDAGLPVQPIGPPDPNFDHANFYYRNEYAGPYPTTVFSGTTIGWDDMGATALAYSGMVVRIIEGTGRGQERSIATNDMITLTIASAWSTVPDSSSVFTIAEPSWKFAALSSNSPAQFEISYRSGTVIQISGRAANAANQEGNADLCPLTRWTLGGGAPDVGLASAPGFSLSAIGGGELSLFSVSFASTSNIESVTSGTLQLFHWNELNTPTTYSLSAAVDSVSTSIQLNRSAGPFAGQVIQVELELMTVLSSNSNTNTYFVVRGALGSAAVPHIDNSPVFHLDSSVVVVPFAIDFFENRASANYIHTLSLPDVRIAGAEFYVTNSFGNSPATQVPYTSLPDTQTRTLSGGQFSLQFSGYLATQQNAAPPLIVQATHAVRDIRATLSQAPSGYDLIIDIFQNGNSYCSVTIPSGKTTSTMTVNGVILALDGVNLPPLVAESMLTMNLTLNVIGNPNDLSPGRDLTVTIRF